jgi:hypothetical protein
MTHIQAIIQGLYGLLLDIRRIIPGLILEKSRHFGAVLLILMPIVTTGCITIPIPTTEKKILAGQPVTEEQLAFLVPGVTTREEVVRQLGNPHIIWEDARIITYDWDVRRGILLWAVGGYATGTGGIKDIPKHYLLILQFDENDRVLRFEKAIRPLSRSYMPFLKDWAGVDDSKAVLKTDEKTIVLLRIRCLIDNQPVEPFIKFSLKADPILSFGLGSFDTAGNPVFTGSKFLSEESRRSGWTYFELSPGIYYLSVFGPDSSLISIMGSTDSEEYIQKAPRWKLDIPEKIGRVYAGTVELKGKVAGALLFGAKIIKPANSEDIPVINEHEAANQILSEHFPGMDEVKILLLERWQTGDPVSIRSNWP